MFCKNCGTKLPEGSEFCPACDTKIAEEVTSGHNSGTKEVYGDAAQQTTGATTPTGEPQQGGGAVGATIAENTQSPSAADVAKAKKNATQRKIAKIGDILELVSLVLLFLSSFWNIPISPIILVVGVAVGLVLSTLGTKRPWGFRKTMKLIVGVILLVVFTVFALKFGGSDDKYIQMVKNGTLESYPQMTVGEAFDGYLNNPKWETGLTEDKQRFVNVKGGILYYDENAEIAVQFFVNEKDNSFQYYACEVNGLPQNDAVVLELFETIYGTEATDEQNQVEQTTPEATLEPSPAPNVPVYDVDELALRLGTRQTYLYEEGAPLYGKYDQCEQVEAPNDRYGVKYGDLTILGSRALDGDIVQISTTNPKTFQKNGISLDKSETDLTAIFGEAEFGGQEQGIYYLTFLCDGYSLSVKFNDPAQAPYEIIIHY